ncbi:MAG: gliding motility-associated C-terminal domain-containing protein [Bacteroidales bacterium]|nr:gliding motility-associated C-terminal domain-containing protein [Bacteroidales bacterium]
MSSFLHRLYTLFLILCLALFAQAQSSYSIIPKDPTCPDPSNGSITFTVENKEGSAVTYSFVIISVFESSKTILNQKVTVEDGQSYTFVADNLDYQYYDAESGEIKTEIQYIAYISDGTKTLTIEPNINFKKPEYSANLSMLRGSGCEDQPIGKASVTFNLGVPPYSWDWYKISDASYPLHTNNEQVTDMSAGKYFVTVTDFAGCKINSDTVEIKPIDIKVTAAVVKNIICKDVKQGIASASVINAYKDNCTINWIGSKTKTLSVDENGNASDMNDELPAGDVFVAVEDEIGCRDTTKVVLTQPEIKLELSETHTDLLCKDEPTGTITCTTTNAVGAVTYIWSDDATVQTANRTELAADIPYTVIAQDANGCSDTVEVTLTQPLTKVEITDPPIGTEPSCFGYSDGKIELEVTGGDVGGYSYYWNSVLGTSVAENVSAGDYTIVAKDANGCSDTLQYHLDEPPSMEPQMYIDGMEGSTKTLQCNGEKADLEIKTNDLYSPKTYKWDTGEWGSSTVKKDALPGNYEVTIKASNGCEEKVTASLIEPEKLNIEIVEETPILCNGSNGSLHANVVGGSGTYTYVWSNGSTGNTSGAVSEGTHTVVITDSYGCSTTASHTLTAPERLDMKIKLSPETCKKASLGELSVAVAGGSGSYTYQWLSKTAKTDWKSIGTTANLSSLDANSVYKLVITDDNGCEAKDSVDLSLIEEYNVYSYIKSSVSCPVTIDNLSTAKNTNDGELWFRVISGFSPFEVTVASESRNVTFENVYDGVDTGKYWNSYASYNGTLPVSDIAQVSVDSVPVGSYVVTVVDYRGCERVDTIQMEHNTSMKISILDKTSASCTIPNGTAQISVSGGKAYSKKGKKYYLYEWESGETTAKATSLGSGDNIVKVTDARGCIARDTVTIESNTALRVKALTDDALIHCVDGNTGKASASVYYEGDDTPHTYTFAWSKGIFDASTGVVTDLPKGTHVVTVTDDEGCVRKDSITFVEDEILTIAGSLTKDVLCYGESTGEIILNSVTGGVKPYTYSWNNGSSSSILSAVPAGTYSVTVQDASGCNDKADFTLSEPEELILSLGATTDEVCPGNPDGTAQVSVVGGMGAYNIVWDNIPSTNTSRDDLSAGSHSVVAVDANGCKTNPTPFVIKKKSDALRVVSSTITAPKCGELIGAISISAAGSATGDYDYSWAVNGVAMAQTTPSISGLKVGTYQLTISDGVCSYDTTFVLAAEDVEKAEGTLTYLNSTCDGDSYSISISNEATADYSSYEWRNQVGTLISTSTTATNLTTGTYSVSAVDKTGCVFVGSYPIEQKIISVEALAQDITCNGGSNGGLTAVPNGNFVGSVTYTWYDAANNVVGSGASLSNIAVGSYYVKAYDANHITCPAQSAKVNIIEPEELVALTSVVAPSYCNLHNGVVAVDVVHGVAPFTYTWKSLSDGVTQKTETVAEARNTFNSAWTGETFVVEIVDNNGCSVSVNAQTTDVSDFSVYGYVNEPIHCVGDATASLQVMTVNGYEPFAYSWSHNSSLNNATATALSAGIYSVTVTDAKGCAVSYTFDALEDAQPLTIEFTETPEIICYGSVGNLYARVKDGKSAPYSYQWYSDSDELLSSEQELEDVKSGTYKVQATDKFGCTSDVTSYTIKEPTKLQSKFTVKITECGDNANTGVVSLDTIYGGLIGADYRFRWTINSVDGDWIEWNDSIYRTLADLPAGTVVCTITNATDYESCYISDTMSTNPIMPMAINTKIKDTHCGYYRIEDAKSVDGSIEIIALQEAQGDYKDVVDANIADYLFTWHDTDRQTGTLAKNLGMDTYEVTVTGKNGCAKTFDAGTVGALVTLDAKIVTTEDLIENRAVICLEDSVSLTAITNVTLAPGYVPENETKTYNWNSVEVNKAATISDNNAETTFVNPLTKYYNDSTLVTMAYTFDGCFSKPVDFSIAHYDSVAFALEVYDSLGVYLGEDSLSVPKDLRYLITPKDEPWFVSKPDEDGIVSISWHSYKANREEVGDIRDTVTNEKSYLSSGNYGLYIPCRESNYYTAVATTTHGCRQLASIYVEVHLVDVIPSGFSPNGDGINDTWIIPKLINCPNAVVTVYNRWGVLVFENKLNYYDHPWNGTSMNGNPLPMGTYYYVIEYNDANDTPTATGSVSILR